MPAFSNTRSSGAAVSVKGSLRRASPALDRAHRTLSVNPAHSNFKRGSFSMSRAEAKAAVGPQGIINSAGNMSYETSIDGRTFGAMISFEGAGDRIRWIELRGEGIGKLSVADCHAEREA